MEYQKIINLLDNTPNQLTKFRTNNCAQINVMHMERVTLIVKLNLKFQCQNQV